MRRVCLRRVLPGLRPSSFPPPCATPPRRPLSTAAPAVQDGGCTPHFINAKKVLVLNTDYRPLGVTTLKRGLALMQEPDAKAQVIEVSGIFVRSEALHVELPSVVVMHRYVKVRDRKKDESAQLRSQPRRLDILNRDNHTCMYCGRPAVTVDHVLPRSKGGGSSWENLASACQACNTKKGSQLLSQCGFKLRKRPAPPKSLVKWQSMTILRQHKSCAEVWGKYLAA